MQFYGLVTGSADLIADVSSAMSGAGWDVLGIDRPDLLGERCRTFGPASFDCYIQLPADIEVGSSTSLDRIKGLLTQGLLRRISGASRVLPLLRPGACVVLASGDRHPPVDSLDDRGARRRLLNVIAQSILADTSGSNIAALVLDEDWSADAIVKLVCHHTLVAGALEGGLEGAERASGTSSGSPVLAEVAPDLAYSEWRDELFSLCGVPHRTYLGWSAADGRRRVAILRGAVLTPLRAAPSLPSSLGTAPDPLVAPSRRRSSQTGWAWPPGAVSAKVLSQAVPAAGGAASANGRRLSSTTSWMRSSAPSRATASNSPPLMWVSQRGLARPAGGAGDHRLRLG